MEASTSSSTPCSTTPCSTRSRRTTTSVTGGTCSAVGSGFRIAAEAGEFLVVVSPDGRSDASLRFEAMLLAHLADKAYLAPRLVRTRAGRPWHRSAAGAAVLVSEWVTGGAVDASLAQHRRRSVRALAEYHAAVRSFPPRLRVEGGPTLFALEQEGPAALEAFTGISGWYLDADGRQRLRSASSYLWRQYIRVPELLHAGGATLPRLVIHGDFGCGAVVLDGGRAGSPADGLAGFRASPLRRPGPRSGWRPSRPSPGCRAGSTSIVAPNWWRPTTRSTACRPARWRRCRSSSGSSGWPGSSGSRHDSRWPLRRASSHELVNVSSTSEAASPPLVGGARSSADRSPRIGARLDS